MKKKRWNENNIADQSGRIAIVTGSSSGIGFESARVLALKKAKVIIAVRNIQKGERAKEIILAEIPKADLEILELDLASLDSVRKFADDFQQRHSYLDLLINNAGVMMPPYSKTSDGFELQMGTNHLGHFALTALLFPLLRQKKGSRIVNVSSMAHKGGKINFEDLDWSQRKYKAMKSYGDSKIANLYFTRELKERMNEKQIDVKVVSAHPGWTATELQRHVGLFSFLNRFFAQDIPMGALPTLYAAVADDVESGDYYGPSGFMEMKGYPKKVEPSEEAKKPEVSEKLWKISEKLTRISFPI